VCATIKVINLFNKIFTLKSELLEINQFGFLNIILHCNIFEINGLFGGNLTERQGCHIDRKC